MFLGNRLLILLSFAIATKSQTCSDVCSNFAGYQTAPETIVFGNGIHNSLGELHNHEILVLQKKCEICVNAQDMASFSFALQIAGDQSVKVITTPVWLKGGQMTDDRVGFMPGVRRWSGGLFRAQFHLEGPIAKLDELTRNLKIGTITQCKVKGETCFQMSTNTKMPLDQSLSIGDLTLDLQDVKCTLNDYKLNVAFKDQTIGRRIESKSTAFYVIALLGPRGPSTTSGISARPIIQTFRNEIPKSDYNAWSRLDEQKTWAEFSRNPDHNDLKTSQCSYNNEVKDSYLQAQVRKIKENSYPNPQKGSSKLAVAISFCYLKKPGSEVEFNSSRTKREVCSRPYVADVAVPAA